VILFEVSTQYYKIVH